MCITAAVPVAHQHWVVVALSRGLWAGPAQLCWCRPQPPVWISALEWLGGFRVCRDSYVDPVVRGAVLQMAMSAAAKKAREQARALIDRNEQLLSLAGEYFAAEDEAAKITASYEGRLEKLIADRDSQIEMWRAARARTAAAMVEAGASRAETATRLATTPSHVSKLVKLAAEAADTPQPVDRDHDGEAADTGTQWQADPVDQH